MKNISLPQKVTYKDDNKNNQSFITIEPCYPGYGMTLGNSIRRVLLSNLPGAAVVGVKIKGVTHEFTTLPNVKEDILEIILNLKQLRLKIFDDVEEKTDEDFTEKKEIKLILDINEKKQIKAKDITKNSQVEIINPELEIAQITNIAGSLNIEIFVSKGVGYRPVEMIEEKRNEIGYIEMDAFFSPVLRTGIKVENMRVGKMTNWDRLVLDVKTDGTITAKEAFENSVNVLIKQFGALISDGEDKIIKKEDKEKKVDKKVNKKDNKKTVNKEKDKKDSKKIEKEDNKKTLKSKK